MGLQILRVGSEEEQNSFCCDSTTCPGARQEDIEHNTSRQLEP